MQALVNVTLTVLDMVEKRHNLAFRLCRWRNGLNNFTLVLATGTVLVDAIWNGFGWDSSRHGGRRPPVGPPLGDPEADAVDAAAAAAAADADDGLP